MVATGSTWDREADVVVVGSGGSALTAAILAHDYGAEVVILERSDKVGGTTAVSGGGLWIPLNDHVSEVGIADSREEALAYCKRLTMGRAPDEHVETFVDTGHQMVRYLEEHTPLRFVAQTMPDYHPEEDGGKLGGRIIESRLYNKRELGEWADRLRPAPVFFLPFPLEDLFKTYQAILKPQNLPMELLAERLQDGSIACGQALIAGLLRACLDRGIPILLETRARELIQQNGRVVGLRAEHGGRDVLVKGRGGVVLASGGFEWNDHLKSAFLPGVVTHPNSPPFNEGDALTMAIEVGADLGNMSEAWWFPSAAVPGEEYEGHPLSRLVLAERTAPHSIIVNRQGRRFVNEAANYNDMAKAFNEFDASAFAYRNIPSWVIFDRQYREQYVVLTAAPSDPDPDWLVKDDSLEGLAHRVGIDPEGLAETVSRFNSFVEHGKDRDFGRGDSAYDRYMGDQQAAHPTLGTVEEPPFYALPLYPGALGTKGGPRTNTRGQVLNVRGEVIPGLYAAGNAMAGLSGPGYYGGGGTIGPGMTWGYLCGMAAAQEAKGAVVR